MGGVSDMPLLRSDMIVNEEQRNGGIIVVAVVSHTAKTTSQEKLRT